MLFCPNCQNLLNISKNILAKENVLDTNTPQTVSESITEVKQVEKNSSATNSTNNIIAYHICTICYYYEPIEKETLIMSKNNENTSLVDIDYKMLKDSKYSSILPRTRAYICKNSECDTYKGAEREAIFFRKNSEQLNTYLMCTICDTIWKL